MKKIIGILVCMLMVVPALSMTAVADPETEIFVVVNYTFLFGQIINLGYEDAENVSWTVTINQRGFIISDLEEEYSGSIDVIRIGTQVDFDLYNGTFFGLGIIIVNAEASGENAEMHTYRSIYVVFGKNLIHIRFPQIS